MSLSLVRSAAQLLASKQLELIYQRDLFSFPATLLLSGTLAIALWPMVNHSVLLVWLLSLWLVMVMRHVYARRFLKLVCEEGIEHYEKWQIGMLAGAAATGLCWGLSVLNLSSSPTEPASMLLLFVLAGVTAFAGISMAAVPLVAKAFLLPSLLPVSFWLFSFGERLPFFMGVMTLGHLGLMLLFSRQSYQTIRSLLATTEQNKELAVALAQVKVLERESALFRHVVDKTIDPAIFVSNAKNQDSFDYINEAVCAHFGASREEIMSRPISDWDPHYDEAKVAELEEVLKQAGSIQFESEHFNATGERFPVDVTLNLIEFQGESFVVGYFRSLTQYKAEQARMRELESAALRQESEQRRERDFRSLADNLPDNIARWDVEGRYLYLNPTHERTLGVRAVEMIGKRLGEAFPDGRFDPVDASIAQVVSTGQAALFVRQPVPFENGETQIHDVTLVPERDADGCIVSVLGIGRDMTNIYRMQEDIAAREQEFRSLAESSPDLIIRVDRDLRIRYLNANMVKFLELGSAQEVIGRPSSEIWPDGRFNEIDALRKRVVTSGEMEFIELAVPIPGGKMAYHQVVTVSERDTDGHIVGTLTFGRDITAIREAEQRFAHFVDNLPGLAYTFHLSKEGTASFPYVSKAVEKIYGLKPEEVRDDFAFIHMLAHPDDRPIIEAAIAESARTMTSFSEETRVCRPGHPELWLDVRSKPEQQSDGSILWYGLMLDITERKQAQQKMELLDRAIDMSADAVLLIDEQLCFVYVNDGACRTLGYSREELLAMGPCDIDDTSMPHAEMQAIMDNSPLGQAISFESRHRGRDGRSYLVEISAVHFEEGGKRFGLTVARDISGRKQAEESLRESFEKITELNLYLEKTARDLEVQTVELEASQEQLKRTEEWYRSILQSAPDGMLVVDSRGLIMQVNTQLETMFGYGGRELAGCHIEELLPHAARAGHVGVRNAFIASGDRDRRMAGAAQNLFGCRKDGSEFPVDVSLSRLPDLDGRVGAICASVRDVSDRQKMDVAREAALSEALRLAQLRSTFMAQMSHELRTPLNGILGYAQNLLQGEALGEKQVAGLHIIRQSGEHLLLLINGILDHAAIEAGKFELIPDDIELEPFLSTLIGIACVRAEQKNISFTCDAGADLPAIVRGDAQRLRQVLLNLLANAVNFTDSGEVILRVSYIAPCSVRFVVQDSGVGIAADQLENIFLSFEQAGETHRRAGCTGLGLAISRKLVRLMGSDIKVESRLGEGCTFSFEIEMELVRPGATRVNAAALAEQAATCVAQAMHALPVPPKHDLDILYGMAMRGSMRDVMRHADKLVEADGRYLPFADQLRRLSKGFQTKALIGLIAQYQNENRGLSNES